MEKTAEEILENYCEPDSGWLNKELIIKAMQAYHEAKLKEELIDYELYIGTEETDAIRWVEKYLKHRNNDKADKY